MSDPQSPSAATQLIDALVEGGEPVDEGAFTLDPVAAAAKMKAFQYADRGRYLIPLVEALHSLDASRVALTAEGVDLNIQASAIMLDDPSRALFELFSWAIGSPHEGPGRALARLAVAVDMALGHGSIERIVIAYGGADATHVAEYREGAAPRVTLNPPGPRGQLRVFIDRSWSNALSTGGTTGPELEQLRRAVRFSERELTLNGRPISQHERDFWDLREGEGEGFRYVIGLESSGEAVSEIELWTEGIQVDRLDGQGLAVRAALDLDDPRRDLSQLKVVRDELVERARAVLEQERKALLHELEQADKAWTGSGERPPQWPEARVDRVLGRPVREPEGEVTSTAGRVGMGLFAVPFYLAGIAAGGAAVGLLVSGQLMGLFVAIFFFSHGGIGAKKIAAVFSTDPNDQKTYSIGLLVIGGIVSVIGGLSGAQWLF